MRLPILLYLYLVKDNPRKFKITIVTILYVFQEGM